MRENPTRRDLRSLFRKTAVGLPIVAAGFFVPGWAAPVHAAGDREFGEYLSSECATCHQTSGRQVGAIPAIVGLPADQFVALMAAYRDGQRENQIMRAIAVRLGTDEIKALAAYYESLKPAK